MSKKYFLYPYKMYSQSAKSLAKELGIKRIKHNNSKFKPNEDKVIINWGSSHLPDCLDDSAILNRPEDVELCSNKIKFFTYMNEFNNINIPEFTVHREEACKWLLNGETVVCRHLVTSHSGRGIEIVSPLFNLPTVPLYTKYIKKKKEYRVHIFKEEIFDFQMKAVAHGVKDINYKVQTHDNGFIFIREGITLPEVVEEQALRANYLSDLDFCAVDLLWNEHENKAYVIEINTAPGLIGTTLENYKKVFKNYMQQNT